MAMHSHTQTHTQTHTHTHTHTHAHAHTHTHTHTHTHKHQSCPHCLVKYPKRKLCDLIHGPLPPGATCNCPEGRYPFERRFNWILDGVRGRVEKIIGQIVHHASFNNVKSRSHYNLLVAAVKLTLHVTAVWSRIYPQYPGHGDYPHDFS